MRPWQPASSAPRIRHRGDDIDLSSLSDGHQIALRASALVAGVSTSESLTLRWADACER